MVTKSDVRMLELARRLAYKANYYQRMGCVVTKKRKILGVGYNHPKKTHPRSNAPYQTVHAELDAVLGLSFDELRGSTVYIARIFNNGQAALAMPCSHCMEMLKSLEVKRVVFTQTGKEPETLLL